MNLTCNFKEKTKTLTTGAILPLPLKCETFEAFAHVLNMTKPVMF